jgi:hypothetical protein
MAPTMATCKATTVQADDRERRYGGAGDHEDDETDHEPDANPDHVHCTSSIGPARVSSCGTVPAIEVEIRDARTPARGRHVPWGERVSCEAGV